MARIRDVLPPPLRSRIAVLPNAVMPAAVYAEPARPAPDGRLRLVAVGRLAHQKGFDRLIAAFAAVAREFPGWDLVIYGEGALRPKLEQQAAQLGLPERVRLPGLCRDIPAALAESHLFALPSRYEGFPNALGEAAACGLPAIAYADVSGVAELIEPGVSGLTVSAAPDAEASLAAALRTLMGDPARRAELGKAAKTIAARYAPERVLGRWERLLHDAVNA